MNTATGRVYDLDELYQTDADKARLEAMLEMATAMYPAPTPKPYTDALEPLSLDEQRAEYERALAAGDAVPIASQVAQTVRLGERERSRRRARRKAARAARKAQR